jgi:hypothetical protein
MTNRRIIKEIRLTRLRPNPNLEAMERMGLTCEEKVWKDKAIAVVLENAYDSSLGKFDRLFEVAQKDFPWLKRGDVEIVHYGGNRRSGLFGIEFTIPHDVYTPPMDGIQFLKLSC